MYQARQAHRSVGRRIGLLAFAACLCSLTACTQIELALGVRTRLDKLPVTAVSATLVPGPGLGPGKHAALVITATTSDGKQYVTEGAGHGKVLFDSFTFTPTIATVDKKGIVALPADPRLSENQMPHLALTVVGHADVGTELDIPVRYDVAFHAHFSGKAGANGSDGFNGSDGSAGQDGSVPIGDPTAQPSAGGNGTNGGDGQDGGDGAPGQPGENVHVWLTLQAGDHPLLQARVASPQHEKLFLIDPQGGTLSVDANGGAGGRGGSGGRGGRGGSGGSGFPPGFAGLDGRNGFDGSRGRDGAAGTIVVSIDPSAQRYQSLLSLSNQDGAGRPGTPPEITIEPVPPLW
jgi:hypothetical protein